MENKYFFLEESMSHPHHYLLRPNFDLLPLTSTSGSYNVFAARIMNLSYAQYLRMCRDILNAEIHGKNTRYPVAYFEKNKLMHQFLKLLNKRTELALKYRAIPDLEEQIEFLKKQKEKDDDSYSRA